MAITNNRSEGLNEDLIKIYGTNELFGEDGNPISMEAATKIISLVKKNGIVSSSIDPTNGMSIRFPLGDKPTETAL